MALFELDMWSAWLEPLLMLRKPFGGGRDILVGDRDVAMCAVLSCDRNTMY
jgi:hypothetical protein